MLSALLAGTSSPLAKLGQGSSSSSTSPPPAAPPASAGSPSSTASSGQVCFRVQCLHFAFSTTNSTELGAQIVSSMSSR